jgi:hypothetical protein
VQVEAIMGYFSGFPVTVMIDRTTLASMEETFD